MSKKDRQQTGFAQSLAKALRDEGSPWTDRLAGLGVDALLEHRVDELVDAETIAAALDASLQPEAIKQAVERVAVPAWSREQRRAKLSGEAPRGFLTPEADRDLLAALEEPIRFSPGIIREIVNAPAVRALLGALIQETLVDFVSRAPIPGLSKAMNLMSRMGRRIENQTERHVRDFLDKSMARITARAADLVSAEANRAQLGQLRAAAVSQALDRPLSAYYERFSPPLRAIWQHLPDLIAHNLARPDIKKAIDEEIRVFLLREGGRTAAHLLDQLGARQRVRDLAVKRATKAIDQVVATDAFAEWLEELVNSAGR